jgi:hypothetical protein
VTSKLHLAAKQHLLAAAHLQGMAFAQRAMKFARVLQWGQPTNVHQEGNSITLTFKYGRITGSLTGTAIAIYPNG